MNKNEFLATLRERLNGLPEEDIIKSIDFYGEMLDDRIEDGMSEEEAVSDLGNIDEIKFDKSLTSNIDSYADDENKAVLDLLVSVYGGVSVNTEFEILTGASFSFWRPGFIAYTQYYNKANAKLATNLIKEFNNNGYETIYLTPWGDTSYKSKFVGAICEYSFLDAER